MGVTPRLVVGTWVGGEDRWIRFLSIGDGQGSKLARPIVGAFFQKLEKDPKSGYDYNAKFQRPPGDLGIEINCAAYQNAAGVVGDEEEFAPDIYGDEAPEGGKPADPNAPKTSPAKKPDGGFGDQYDQ
jgi:penicillin-binding protein 1A